MPKRPAQIITIESSHEKGEQVVADATHSSGLASTSILIDEDRAVD